MPVFGRCLKRSRVIPTAIPDGRIGEMRGLRVVSRRRIWLGEPPHHVDEHVGCCTRGTRHVDAEVERPVGAESDDGRIGLDIASIPVEVRRVTAWLIAWPHSGEASSQRNQSYIVEGG